MEGTQKKNIKLDQTLKGCVISFDTIPEECIKAVIHRYTCQYSLLSCTPTVEKYASDSVVEPDMEYLMCQGYQQRYFARGNSSAAEVPNQSCNSLHHQKKILTRQTQMLRRLVRPNSHCDPDLIPQPPKVRWHRFRQTYGSHSRNLKVCSKHKPLIFRRLKAKS